MKLQLSEELETFILPTRSGLLSTEKEIETQVSPYSPMFYEFRGMST